jgi:hypothetical protein
VLFRKIQVRLANDLFGSLLLASNTPTLHYFVDFYVEKHPNLSVILMLNPLHDEKVTNNGGKFCLSLTKYG